MKPHMTALDNTIYSINRKIKSEYNIEMDFMDIIIVLWWYLAEIKKPLPVDVPKEHLNIIHTQANYYLVLTQQSYKQYKSLDDFIIWITIYKPKKLKEIKQLIKLLSC